MRKSLRREISDSDSRGKAIRLEMEIVEEFSGLDPSVFMMRDVMVGENEFLHVTEINTSKDKELPKLLMLHGFGGSNTNFYKMFGPLSLDFHVVSVDIPGMGLSSRDSFPDTFESLGDCVDFVVSQMHGLVESLGWKRFSIIAHSMGSFFSGHFFDAFEHLVDKIFLLSPAGFNRCISTEKKSIENCFGEFCWWQKHLLAFLAPKIFGQKKSPFELMPDALLDYGIDHYYSSGEYGFSASEREKMGQLSKIHLRLPQKGERFVGHVFDWSLQTSQPLSEVFARHPHRAKDVAILYGEIDWMDFDKSLQSAKHLGLHGISFFQIQNSDHQILFHSPQLALRIFALFRAAVPHHELELCRLGPKQVLSKTS